MSGTVGGSSEGECMDNDRDGPADGVGVRVATRAMVVTRCSGGEITEECKPDGRESGWEGVWAGFTGL
jgi:hypothetical protein